MMTGPKLARGQSAGRARARILQTDATNLTPLFPCSPLSFAEGSEKIVLGVVAWLEYVAEWRKQIQAAYEALCQGPDAEEEIDGTSWGCC